MKIIKMQSPYYNQNTYLLICKKTNESILIDCGDVEDKILSSLEEEQATLKYIVLTHCHFDHIESTLNIKQKTGAKIFAHKDESENLSNPHLNLSQDNSPNPISIILDHELSDDEIINFGEQKLKVIFTPGHTKGGICLYNENSSAIFTGDTLFRRTIGRSDLPSSSTDDLINNIKTKLLILPIQTKIFPGHFSNTTIEFEIRNNPYLK